MTSRWCRFVDGDTKPSPHRRDRGRGRTYTDEYLNELPAGDGRGWEVSPAVNPAGRVLPVPEEPDKRAPRGIFAPGLSYEGKPEFHNILFGRIVPATPLSFTSTSVSSLDILTRLFLTSKIPPPTLPPEPALWLIQRNRPANRVVVTKPGKALRVQISS